MQSVNGLRAEPVSPLRAEGQRSLPPAHDAEAMRQAIEAARQRLARAEDDMPLPGIPAELPFAAPEPAPLEAEEGPSPSVEGLGTMAGGLGATTQVVAVPQAPPPHVDPAAFATLISRLWAREQAKGSREIRLSFGERAGAAVGARLVRGADGALDIILIARGNAVERALPELRQALAQRGIALGALGVAREG